jgi:hypothetical protein
MHHPVNTLYLDFLITFTLEFEQKLIKKGSYFEVKCCIVKLIVGRLPEKNKEKRLFITFLYDKIIVKKRILYENRNDKNAVLKNIYDFN